MADADKGGDVAAQSDMDVLFPGEDIKVRLRGKAEPETVRVEPFYSLQWKPAMAKIKPIAKTVFGVIKPNENGSISLKLSDDFFVTLLDSAGDGADALIDFVAFAIGKPREWFADVPADSGGREGLGGLYELAEAVYRQNSDFFKRRVLPMLKAWMPAASAPGGAPSLPASSPTDTPELKSIE